MAKFSAKDMINAGDFEAAKEKYENANKQWKNHWWETCVEIYNKFVNWAQKYTLDLIHKTISAIKRKRGRPAKYSEKIIWNCPENTSIGEKFYLVELLDKNGDLIWSKIGTTKRTIAQRMKEILRDRADKGVEFIRVNRVYNLPFKAEFLESLMRSFYGSKFKDFFEPLDRFYHVVFDLEEADQKVAEYCAIF